MIRCSLHQDQHALFEDGDSSKNADHCKDHGSDWIGYSGLRVEEDNYSCYYNTYTLNNITYKVDDGCTNIHVFFLITRVIFLLTSVFFLIIFVLNSIIIVLFDKVLFLVVVGMLIIFMFFRLLLSLNYVFLIVFKKFGIFFLIFLINAGFLMRC